jgi:hypothetical protein
MFFMSLMAKVMMMRSRMAVEMMVTSDSWKSLSSFNATWCLRLENGDKPIDFDHELHPYNNQVDFDKSYYSLQPPSMIESSCSSSSERGESNPPLRESRQLQPMPVPSSQSWVTVFVGCSYPVGIVDVMGNARDEKIAELAFPIDTTLITTTNTIWFLETNILFKIKSQCSMPVCFHSVFILLFSYMALLPYDLTNKRVSGH